MSATDSLPLNQQNPDVEFDQAQQQQAKSLKEWIAPVIRVFADQRVTAPAFLDAVKEAFVEEAQRNGATTVSEIATYCGLSGYEVRKIQKAGQSEGTNDDEVSAQTKALNPEGKVLEIWRTSSLFRDADGAPKVLPIKGKGASFERLVRHALGNVSYDPILASLEAEEVVVVELHNRRDRKVRMIKQNFYPRADSLRLLKAGARCARHFQQSLVNNLSSETAADKSRIWPQQEVFTARLAPDQVAEFREKVQAFARRKKDETFEFLVELEDQMNMGPQNAESIHAGVGLYYFEDRTWPIYEGQETD